MVEIPDRLASVFTAIPDDSGEDVVLEVPQSEVDAGAISPGETYRVCLLEVDSVEESSAETSQQVMEQQGRSTSPASPPVEEGDQQKVTIESLGEQGDGIAKLDGYVVIVPDTEVDETVLVEIEEARENVAFATVVKRLDAFPAR